MRRLPFGHQSLKGPTWTPPSKVPSAASVPSAAGYAAGSSKGSSPTASGSPSRAPGGFRLPLRDPSRLGKDGDERSTSAKSGGSDENV